MPKEPAVKESLKAGDSSRHAPLAMDAATFSKLGHRLVDQVAGFLESLPLGPVTHDESPSIVRDALDLTEAARVLRAVVNVVCGPALVRFAVAGSANFLDPFKKNIRPFVKSRFVNILRAYGAQSLHLLLIHHVEASYPEDRFHGFTIQTR